MFRKKVLVMAMAAMLLGGSVTGPVTAQAASVNNSKAVTQSSSSFKKTLYRAEFKTVALAGKAAGYMTAAEFLNHSLQNSPSALSYEDGSALSNQIEGTSEYASLLYSLGTSLAGGALDTYEKSGIVNFTSDTDLKLAIHGVKYTASAVREHGYYTIDITFTDTYNFEASEWSQESFSSKVLNILNNHAASAQSAGAIVPYDITIHCGTYFYY